MLLGAIGLHLGIVTALGMPTFGLAMLIANLAYVSPKLIRLFSERVPLDGKASSHSTLKAVTKGHRIDVPAGEPPQPALHSSTRQFRRSLK